MESVDLDMGDLFDEEAMDDDDVGAVSALPNLPEYNEEGEGQGSDQGDNEESENTEVLAKLKDLSKGAAKKRVSRPQPKLDATRLTGERGIPILPKVFEKVKFKGRGHEAEDLAVLMRNFEHWAHRLFPKMPFDEVLERAERLGAKREVQTCVKKMRLDMPILNDDFVGSDQEGDDVHRQGDDLPPQTRTDQELQDEWDELIREAEESQASQTLTTPSQRAPGPSTTSLGPSAISPGPSPTSPGPSQATPGPFKGTPGLRYDTPGPAESTEASQISTPAQQRTTTDSPFTPEQLERMERNKQLAREKRLAKLGVRSPATPTLSRPSPGASQRVSHSQTLPTQTTQRDQTQTTQGDQTDRVTSPHSQTGLTTKVNSGGKPSDIQSSRDSEEISGDTQLNSEDDEMSEVIRTQNDKVVVHGRLQDAQNWCTEPSERSTENDSVETDSAVMSNDKQSLPESDIVEGRGDKVIGLSQKSAENETVESENSERNGGESGTKTALDSEEMSEVIPFQDGKIPFSQKLGTQNTESFDEMSEVIERQDFQTVSKHSNKENMASLVNGTAEVNETGDLKSKDSATGGNKGKVLNGLDSNIAVNGDNNWIHKAGDELTEEELMDTLDS